SAPCVARSTANATNVRFTAFSISSTNMNTLMALRLNIRPIMPMENSSPLSTRFAVKRSKFWREVSIESLLPPGGQRPRQHHRADHADEQQNGGQFNGKEIAHKNALGDIGQGNFRRGSQRDMTGAERRYRD